MTLWAPQQKAGEHACGRWASSPRRGPLSIWPLPVLLAQKPSMGGLGGKLGCGSQAPLPHSSGDAIRVPDSPLSGRTDLRHHPEVMTVSSPQAGGRPWPLSYGPLRGRGLSAGKTTWTGLMLRGLAAQGQWESGLREGHCPGSRAPQQIPCVRGACETLSEAQNTPLPLGACVQGGTGRSLGSVLTSPEMAHGPAATAREPAPLHWWAPRGGHACPSAAPAGWGTGGGS